MVPRRPKQRHATVLVGVLLVSVKLVLDWNLYFVASHHTPPLPSDVLLASWKQTNGLSTTLPIPAKIDSASRNTISPALNSTNNTTTKTRFAYAVVVGGCDPDKPSYRGFFYNTLVAASILRQLGSTSADIILVVQMSYHSAHEALPPTEQAALQALGVQVRYIPKSPWESFYNTVLHKFQILSWTEYDRVLLMDADVMPLANLDYLMELSLSNSSSNEVLLRENVVVAGLHEPANGGFFILQPGEGRWEELQEIVRQQEQNHSNNPNQPNNNTNSSNYSWDPVQGWGHAMVPPHDVWKSRQDSGHLWDFHFAFSDQGLLYYWTKYVQKSVSIIFENTVENYGVVVGQDQRVPHLLETIPKPTANNSRQLIRQDGDCRRYLCDFHHFTGHFKPWLRQPPPGLSNHTKYKNATHLWFWVLKRLNEQLDLGIDFEHWETIQKPPHGLFATYGDVQRRVQSSAHKGGS